MGLGTPGPTGQFSGCGNALQPTFLKSRNALQAPIGIGHITGPPKFVGCVEQPKISTFSRFLLKKL